MEKREEWKTAANKPLTKIKRYLCKGVYRAYTFFTNLTDVPREQKCNHGRKRVKPPMFTPISFRSLSSSLFQAKSPSFVSQSFTLITTRSHTFPVNTSIHFFPGFLYLLIVSSLFLLFTHLNRFNPFDLVFPATPVNSIQSIHTSLFHSTWSYTTRPP